MAQFATLSNTFEEYGFELENNIIEKCADLCTVYGISDAKDFVESYVAFSVNHLNGIEPSLDTLAEFEAKELTNYKKKSYEESRKRSLYTRPEFEAFDGDNFDDGDDVMDEYIGNTPKIKKKGQLHGISTPVSDSIAHSLFATDSPTVKDIPGKVICTFGKKELLDTISWTVTKRQALKIQLEKSANNNQLTTDYNYMFDTLRQKCNIAADRLFDLGQEICAKLIKERPAVYTDELYNNLSHVNVPNQTTIKCIGRVCSDNGSQLDRNSTLLVGADEMKLRTARLSFSRLKSFALFPGQTVFVQGLNPRGEIFYADEIFAERQLNFADPPKLEENLNIVVAAGPFTFPDDLKFELFQELVTYCKQHKPHALILLGPFLDINHKSIMECTHTEKLDTLFEKLISSLTEAIGSSTELLIVSSSLDIHSTAVYPTHPYSIHNSYPNLTFLPDPCVVQINGVTFGMSSTDILAHLTEAELAENMGDKVGRAIKYLFNQRSFYPLNPPSDKISLDSGLTQEFASLMTVPNFLILPSTLRCFIREVNKCLVVNPGKLADGNNRGSFGRIVVTKSSEQNLNSYIAGHIIKI